MDSNICQICGNPIEFITKNGRTIPLHTAKHCCETKSSQRLLLNDTTLYQATCWSTRCPYCDDRVYFVRHNGGCAWFDSLGQPWPKHACMEQIYQYSIEPMSEPTAFPNIDCEGRITYVGPDMGHNRYILIQWDHGVINAYTFLWERKYINIIKPNRRVRYQKMNETIIELGKSTKIRLDKSIAPGTRGLDLLDFKSSLE